MDISMEVAHSSTSYFDTIKFTIQIQLILAMYESKSKCYGANDFPYK